MPSGGKDSKWLYDVLHTIGVNHTFRKACKRRAITYDILKTINFLNIISEYAVGSGCEGVIIPELAEEYLMYGRERPYDGDVIYCDESYHVVEDIAKSPKNSYSYLMVIEEYTPAGYFKLQSVYIASAFISEVLKYMYTSKFLKDLCFENGFEIDRFGRIFLNREPRLENHLCNVSKSKNQPAYKVTRDLPIPTHKTDVVTCYRCKTWPTTAREWLSRERLYRWPTKDTIHELELLGFFVVKKGHPYSRDIDLEWRMSFSLQERKLMFSLTDIQHKCYFVLKMVNRDIINLNCLTSFHWKTCLFYVIERNKRNVWKKKLLFHCIKLCMKQMLKWVKCGFCPNYFIPEDNLFDGKLNDSLRSNLEKILEEILNEGFSCLNRLKSYKICYFMMSRGSLDWSERLKANRENNFKQVLYESKMSIIGYAVTILNSGILVRFPANETITNYIKFLWLLLDKIKKIGTITEHTRKETRRALSLLTPHIYTCLASSISAMAIQHPNPQVRDFLLFGSSTYFIKCDLPGRLKFISVLYAIGLYKECDWFLNQIDEDDIKYKPSVCCCRIFEIYSNLSRDFSIYTTILRCVSFHKTELLIVPDPLKYEMFRYFGSCLQENENNVQGWLFRACVDFNIYFFILNSLIKMKLGRIQDSNDAAININKLLSEKNVRHPDVGYNFLAWLHFLQGRTFSALSNLSYSWKEMDVIGMCITKRIQPEHRQFNSAKLHALVFLHDTWVSRKPSSAQFCFHCFHIGDRLIQCSRCEISTFCSIHCQRENWKVHKTVCKIVRKYHIL